MGLEFPKLLLPQAQTLSGAAKLVGLDEHPFHDVGETIPY
jgi:hypothetical protein